MTAPPGRQQRKCIFCEGANLTKEHFYPQWMASLLPGHIAYGEKVISNHPIHGETINRDASRPASMLTKKLRVVCAACNNGWMNRLEGAARPHLTKMLQGKRFMMSADEQLAVARWCVSKMMVAEHSPESEPMTPPTDRSTFAATLQIPDYYRVYVGAHSCEAQIGYIRRSSTISLRPGGPVPKLDGMRRNVQQATFLVGKAFVHINAARVDGFAIENRFSMPLVQKHMRIWPPTHDRRKWPGGAILNPGQIRFLSNSWEDIARSKRAVWGGEIDPAWL